jgi:hypothetical protein
MSATNEEVISRAELLHAVKNSFNLINSIVDIQLMNTLDEACKANLLLLSRRCKAIMLAQSQLLRSMEEPEMKLVEFLRTVAEKLAAGYPGKGRMLIEIFGEPVAIKLQRINYIALLFTEALSWIWACQPDAKALLRVRVYDKGMGSWKIDFLAPFLFPSISDLSKLENSPDWFLIPLLFKQMKVEQTYETDEQQTVLSFVISG